MRGRSACVILMIGADGGRRSNRGQRTVRSAELGAVAKHAAGAAPGAAQSRWPADCLIASRASTAYHYQV